MKKIVLAVFASLAGIAAQAQNGSVSGEINSSDSRKIADVKISVVGRSETVASDIDGHYHLSLPAGSYVLLFIGERFQEESDSVFIEAGKQVFLNKTLTSVKTMRDAEIKVQRKPTEKGSSIDWSVRAIQGSNSLASAVGAEEIARTPAKTTSDVIKKIPGATITEGKFANIRGMYDRYNASYLNGAPLPSTESDRKAFSFDIIPASLIDNIMVIKSATPDLIGDFGGGIIRINTKNIPDTLTQSFNFGFQYNTITSFRGIQSYQTNASEYFGIPGNNRKIPALTGSLSDPKNAETNSRETQKFNNNWNVNQINPMPAPRFNYTLGLPIKFKGQRELGVLFSLNYSLNQKYSDGEVHRNDLSDNHLISSYQDKLFTSNVQSGGILNFSYKLNSRNRIDWKNLYSINYDASSTFRAGVSDFDNQVKAEGYSNLINYNRLMSTQLNGTHILGKKQNTLTWLVNYGNTNRQIPDFRIAQYAIIEQDRYLVLNDFFNAGSGRFFSDLGENTLSASTEMKHNFELGRMVSNVKYGLFVQNRERSFTSREFIYGPTTKSILSQNTPAEDLSSESLAASGIYLIEKTSTDLDQYTGSSSLRAGFAMMENNYPLFYTKSKPNYLKVIYGVRFEQFSQILRNEVFTNIYKKDVSNTGVTNDFLPSINVITPLTSKTAIRMAYYKTVNRPEMRELAPFSFFNFNLNSEVVGNTNLQRAILHNFDFRYEIFQGKSDMLAIGVFAKRIINPIEFSLDPTQPQIRTFTYRNEKSAKIAGVELEVRKKLSGLGAYFAPGIFKCLSVYGNFAWIQSTVQFQQGGTGTVNRALQGQSPYVMNASLYYDNEKSGWTASVNFNKIASRIAYIGVPKEVQPFGGDIYEFGRNVMDLQLSKNLGRTGTIKLTAGDIFAQKTTFYQDLNGSGKFEKGVDNTLFGFTNGRTLTISYGYSF